MNFIKKLMKYIVKSSAFVIILIMSILYLQAGLKMYEAYLHDEIINRINKIYHNLYIQTGRSGDIPNIFIEYDDDVINAFATKRGIVVYTGMLNFVKNDDELALVLGHEIAHITLGHLDMNIKTAAEESIIESSADKMGALYMMKAGYNICIGRELWKRWKEKDGDYIDKDHPDMAYRYDQLNVGCE